ncbi:DUF4260 domain-containing protein [Sandarakinorhabdus oryzae]|uniref:DUF4260 domain-containing protein n=1 Tax=Sandarakinorhabdus oryzae TaxID=2675220 RepID=UPI0012E12D7D|nr:DUF4260 domain-containing protein [Sandarakinorhabdus oryzae]
MTTAPIETSPPVADASAIHAILRIEGGILLAVSVAAYRQLGGDWGVFALLFLVPDLSMLGYLLGPRRGAMLYNAGHSTIGPALLAAALAFWSPALVPLVAIWTAHIGFDRLLGYGLKYPHAFRATHLGMAVTSLTPR